MKTQQKIEQNTQKNYKGLHLLMFAILFLLWGSSIEAAEYSVAPANAVLYTGSGAEIFAEPDPTTLVTAFPGDIPVQVTGVTNNGYYQVVISEAIYYISGGALATVPGTTAYKLTSMDAREALVGDADTGEIIYMQNALERVEPASTTKIMTALLVMEAIEQGRLGLDTVVTVSGTALSGLPSDASHVTPRLKSGENMNVLALLECVLIKSDCHACNVLAEAVAGSVDNFVVMMNQRAIELGCVDTNFVNTSGYPADNHYTNAYSLFLISREALKRPMFQTITSMQEAVIPATNLSAERKITTTNELLIASEYYNPEVIGIKTGYTRAAGLCLVAAAKRDSKTVISVVLGAKTSNMSDGTRKKMQFNETNKLLEIGFAGA